MAMPLMPKRDVRIPAETAVAGDPHDSVASALQKEAEREADTLDIARELGRKQDPVKADPAQPLYLPDDRDQIDVRELQAAKAVGEQQEGATGKSEQRQDEILLTSRVVSSLAERAASEKDGASLPREQGRMPEHNEQTLNRTIQKER